MFPVELWLFVPIKGTPPVLQNTDPCSVSALVQLEKRLLSQHVQCLWLKELIVLGQLMSEWA